MEISKKARANLLIGFLITIFMVGLMLLDFSPLRTLEENLYDYRFKIRGAIKPPDNIVIAAIDEKSIEKLGRWPWSRDKLANLVERLADAGAEIIVFDIILSEKEKNDMMLAKSIGKAGNVILPVVFDIPVVHDTAQKTISSETVLTNNEFLVNSAFRSVANPEKFNKYNPIKANSVLLPVPKLISNAMALGFINMFPDSDGTLRWEGLAIEYNGYIYPSVTLQAAAAYLGVPPEQVVLKATEGIKLGKRFIPTERWGRTLINYYGDEQTFRYVSISDILEKNINPEFIRGKIVLVGATAVGIYDLRVTPFSPAMPGIEKHASVITSILENKFIREASTGANLSILLLSGLLFSLLLTRVKAMSALRIAGLFLFLIFLSVYYIFTKNGIWVNVAYPSINILLIFIGTTAYNYATEEIYAKRIRKMFSNYVTTKIVDELIKNPDMAKLGGERREVTVLFSDIRGFTTFSEKYAPEEVVAILNEYLGAMTDVIFRWDGTLDKFVGDAIVAFWGAPRKQENHAELAVRCALDMISTLEGMQGKWQKEGKPVLDNGVGINSGIVIVGNIGAEGKKMDYTVIGDNVNLGSRVEGLTRKYGTHILVTGATLNMIRDKVLDGSLGHLLVRGLEKVIVKGKDHPVDIYEVKSVDPGLDSKITECEDTVTKCDEK